MAARGIQEEKVTSILLHDVVVAKDTVKAEKSLLGLPGLKKYLGSLKSDREKDWFRRHLRKYITMYLPDSAFEVTTTNRYVITSHEAAISARKYIPAGRTIKYLTGTLVSITREEEVDLDITRRDFSIVMSSRKKTPSLFLGPARFANHDCNANARLVMTGPESMEVVATRDIDIGDEITVSYGENYFGDDNCECLCETCESAVRNGWASAPIAEQDDDTPTPTLTPTLTPVKASGGALSRRGSSVSAAGRAPDISAPGRQAKRRKLERQPSNLRCEITDPLDGPSVTPMTPSTRNLDATSSITPVKGVEQSASSTRESSPDPLQWDTFSMNAQRTSTSARAEGISNGSVADGSCRSRQVSTPPTSISDTPRQLPSVSAEPIEGTSSCNDRKKDEKSSPQTRRAPQKQREVPFSDGDDDELSELSASWEMDDAKMAIVKQTPKTKKRKRRIVTSVEPEATHARVPGDYTKTPKLLAQRYDRWVDCHTCSAWFVQSDSYLTRVECPRCERHSKLYGFRWPKTDKDGRHDKEERVMDHRTVHRFISSEAESRVERRSRGISQAVSLTPEISDVKSESADVSEAGDGRRRVTRSGRRSARESLFYG